MKNYSIIDQKRSSIAIGAMYPGIGVSHVYTCYSLVILMRAKQKKKKMLLACCCRSTRQTFIDCVLDDSYQTSYTNRTRTTFCFFVVFFYYFIFISSFAPASGSHGKTRKIRAVLWISVAVMLSVAKAS